MPLYTFQHPETEETIDIIQSMNDEHSYVDDKGVKWNRVWHKPNASIDSKIDPNSQADFVRYTGARKGTLGDMQDLSAEMSAKRAEKNNGLDPIKEHYYDVQEKTTGVKSFERKKREANKKLSKLGVEIK